MVDGDLFNAEASEELESGQKPVPLIGMPFAFHEANIGEFEGKQAGR
jgi:hypothetical protein